jgi:hypothetical protein
MRANDIERRSCPKRRRRPRAPRLAWALLINLALGLTACTGPARTSSAYEDKATNTADEVVSASRTVLLAAHVGDEGRSLPTTIAVTIADAETDAQTARDAFASIQPPDETSDQIRAALLPSVQHACDVIAEVRIAARRADTNLSQIAAPLQQIADQLDEFSTRYG